MNPVPVPQRWLIALLGAVFLLDVLISTTAGSGSLALPGAAALLACVYLGVSRPVLAGFAGAGVLVVSSVIIRRTGTVPVWVGLEGLLLSEVLAGCALVVLLAWRARSDGAVAGIATLVIACLGAVGIRAGWFTEWRSLLRGETFGITSLVFGLVLLVVCVAAGVYLRQSGKERVDSALRLLVRRQWPLAAALTVLVLVDLGGASGSLRSLSPTGGTAQLLGLVGAVVAAGCAVLAPRAPVRFALIGAAAIGLTTLPFLIARVFTDHHIGVPFTTTQLASSMALVAFVTRSAPPAPAVWSTLALSAANTAMLIHGTDYLGFLLVVSVATGLYFRARDRERNRTVRVAVSGAQQAERMALARELHDVVAHHVTGIVVQAQAARLVADREPAVAVTALERIADSGTEALTAMRMLVGSLRGAEPAGGASAAAQATSDLAADIRAVVDNFAGPTVHLELNLPDRLPHEMGRSVLRLVQESLTNVSKHAAGASSVRVGVTVGPGDAGDELHVFVKDDGTARRSTPAGGSGGYGLVGMRERVELLGGFFSAGPGSDGGWVVKVALPLRSTS